MITVTVNGEQVQLDGPVTVTALLEQRGAAKQSAVAINGNFVPRNQHADRQLADHDEIDIVVPMQGG